MKTFTINFYADPGHGWGKVSEKKLHQLGLADKISSYSYQRYNSNGKKEVYLEEDCDLYLVVNALKERGVEVKFREFHTNQYSKIRNYEHFSTIVKLWA